MHITVLQRIYAVCFRNLAGEVVENSSSSSFTPLSVFNNLCASWLLTKRSSNSNSFPETTTKGLSPVLLIFC